MRVAVLGCGVQGRQVALKLAASDAVSRLIVADFYPKVASTVASEAGAKAVAQQVDVTDQKSLAAVLEQVDIVLNTVGPFYKYVRGVVQAAIAQKVNYVDINDDYDATEELFLNPEYDSQARQAGIIVLSCMGETPGISNVLVRYASEQLERVKAVHICFAYTYWRLLPAVWRHMLHCLKGEVTQYLGGRYTKVEAFGGQQRIEFLDPVGPREVYYLGHSEPITLPRFVAGLEEVTVKCACYQPEANALLRDLVRYGFANQDRVAGGTKSPADFITEYMASPDGKPYFDIGLAKGLPGGVMQVEVLGENNGQHVRLVYEVHDQVGRTVSSSAAAAVESLARGQISATGVCAPEGCIDPLPFLGKATKQPGVTLREKKEVVAPMRL